MLLNPEGTALGTVLVFSSLARVPLLGPVEAHKDLGTLVFLVMSSLNDESI